MPDRIKLLIKSRDMIVFNNIELEKINGRWMCSAVISLSILEVYSVFCGKCCSWKFI